MNLTLILIIAWIFAFLCLVNGSTEHYQEVNYTLIIPVLIPTNDSQGTCTRKAIEMGFEDISSEKLQYNDDAKNITRRFFMEPLYEVTGDRPIDAVEAMNNVHPFNVKTFRQPQFMKRATIGTPTNEQTNLFSDFAQVLPTIQFSYSEINEPYDSAASLYFQTPPSILGQFNGARAFMETYNWTQAVIVYDFSNSRYRLSSNLLFDVLQKKDSNNASINVVSSTRIRSDSDGDDQSDFNELPNLPHGEARIVLLLAGVPGIRQTFCQAYHLELQKSKFVWLLFEELPSDWASDFYNPINILGRKQREINCTEDQLLSVTQRYIYFTKGALRGDNKRTISNMTADEFKTRLERLSKQTNCDEKSAYAYDAVWTMVKGQQELMKSVGAQYYNNFVYLFGLGFSGRFGDIVTKTNFEGITGHVSFTKNDYRNNIRVGFVTIRVQHERNASMLVGDYDSANSVLTLIPKATEVIFDNVIPSDKAEYVETNYKFPKVFIVVIWLFSFLGIILTAVLLNIIVLKWLLNKMLGNVVILTIDSVISFGCVLCYLSLVIYGIDGNFIEVDENLVYVCYAFLWTLSIGFTLTFGALFAKAWWKYKNFSAPSAIKSQNGSEVSEWFLFVWILVFLLVDIIVIVCWTTESPFKIEYYQSETTPLTFAIEVEYIIKCKGKYMDEFMIGMFCYKGVLLMFGVFLAWQTSSKLKGTSSYSKTEPLAIYNTALVSIVGVMCVSLLRDTNHRHALYAIIAVCVILSTSTTLAMIYVPKISKMLNFDDDGNSSSESDSNREKFNKFTLEKLRRRVTTRNGKLPSISSIQTSTLSISTTTSSLDSRRPTGVSQTDLDAQTSTFSGERRRGSSFLTDTSSNIGSFVSYNPSLVQSSTVLEVPTEEEEPIDDIVVKNPSSI